MYYPLRKEIFLHQLKQLSETNIRRIQEEKQNGRWLVTFIIIHKL